MIIQARYKNKAMLDRCEHFNQSWRSTEDGDGNEGANWIKNATRALALSPEWMLVPFTELGNQEERQIWELRSVVWNMCFRS